MPVKSKSGPVGIEIKISAHNGNEVPTRKSKNGIAHMKSNRARNDRKRTMSEDLDARLFSMCAVA
jgi:hypothetical protein